jgi:hypothetical protein
VAENLQVCSKLVHLSILTETSFPH